MTHFIIVGGGHAAGQAVASLRQEGFDGDITLIGDEPHVPYQRPPLSKQYLAGEQDLGRVYLRPEKFYRDKQVTLELGTRVTGIAPDEKRLTLADGSARAYDKLLLATGSRPRHLSVAGSDLPGVHYLRTIADVDVIRGEMAPGKKVVIVGGGYIGLEVAAVAVKAGLDVTVVEMEDRILKRVTTEDMSRFYTELHRREGVAIRTSLAVSGFAGNGRLTGVTCGAETLAADLAIIGIGVVVNQELAEAAGLECGNGIHVDDRCRTTDTYVYAAGDCTDHPNPLLERRLRLESVPNAMEQARVAAANMAGGDKVYASVPWFWSDQYDLKLQMVGFSADGDTPVVRGDPASRQFAVFYLAEGRVVAVDAVNSPREFMAARQMIGKPADAAKLADPATDLKQLVR